MNRQFHSVIDRPLIVGGVLHVCYAGRSFDISMPGLDLFPQASDEEVKMAIAEYLEVPSYRLDDYVIDRHENGNFTIRPQAIFG